MRAVLVTLPSFTGTLRSSRISTRLPRKSRSVIRLTASGIGFPSSLAGRAAFLAANDALYSAANASVVSSIRFEKPHSLSYHEQIFTSLPSITFVSVES